MARRKAELPAPEAVRLLIEGDGKLAVKVTPGARTEAIAIVDGRLYAKVRAKPENGAANAAVVVLVAEALGVAPSRVTLLRGATSREKLLRIEFTT